MGKHILGSTTEIVYINRDTKERIATARTITESSIEISSNEQEIRGGEGNKLLGKIFTDGNVNISASDALFDFNYMKMVTGGSVSVGGDWVKNPEEVKITQANQITVTGTPVAFEGEICGWYAKAGEDDWHKITFVGKTAIATGLQVGDVVCVSYAEHDDALKEFKVPSTIIPDEVMVIMKTALFSSGDKKMTASSKVGFLYIEVPRFIFSGATTFNFTNSGTSTTDLSGTCLVDMNSTASCNQEGNYCTIKQVLFGADPSANLDAIAIIGGEDIALANGATMPLDIRTIYKDGSVGVPSPSKLTYVSDDTSTVSVSTEGVIEGKQAGNANIEVTYTGTSISTTAKVTVS